LEFIAYVGFIHKESVTMHGHMIIKFSDLLTGKQFPVFQRSLLFQSTG